MAAITIRSDTRQQVPPWAYLMAALAIGVLWLVTFEGGPVSEVFGQANTFLHEVFHDGRHLIGVPCH